MSNKSYFITCSIPEALNTEYEKEYRTSTYDDFWLRMKSGTRFA